MRNKFGLSAMITIFLLCVSFAANAQDNGSVAVRKFELAADFSTNTFDVGETVVGLGGRLTYNLKSYFALEAAGYFFPQECRGCGRHAGQTAEGFFGVKIGKRFHKWGIFGKARPGLMSSSQGKFDFVVIGIPTTSPPSVIYPSFNFVEKRLTTFAMDVGGVVEFYPTKRIITRLDVGSTIIHYGPRTIDFPVFNPVTGALTSQRSTIPAQNRGTLQFMAGVGFRF
jgi:hypothetical protein